MGTPSDIDFGKSSDKKKIVWPESHKRKRWLINDRRQGVEQVADDEEEKDFMKIAYKSRLFMMKKRTIYCSCLLLGLSKLFSNYGISHLHTSNIGSIGPSRRKILGFHMAVEEKS